jgi:hypothetical protein
VTDPHSLPPPADPWSQTDPVPYAGVPTPVDRTRIDPAAPLGPLGPPRPTVVYIEVPRRRRWPWTLFALAVVGALCCGVGGALTAPIWQQYPASVSVGESVAGLQQVHTPEIDERAHTMVVSMRRDQGADQAFAAVLADPADPARQVVVVGGTRFILDPAGELDGAIRGQAKNITDVAPYDPGDLGGELRCGEGRDNGQPVVVCAWIDHGSIGLGIFYGGWAQTDSAALFTAIRQEILYRG